MLQIGLLLCYIKCKDDRVDLARLSTVRGQIISTIYDDPHGAVSVGMWGIYLITAPIHSRVDLIIELFK